MRKSVSVFAQSVSRILPSGDTSFNCTIFSYTSLNPSFSSFVFKSLQYRRGILLSVREATTSITENHHSLLWTILRIPLLLNTTIPASTHSPYTKQYPKSTRLISSEQLDVPVQGRAPVTGNVVSRLL